MSVISSPTPPSLPAVPPACEGLDINFCKNPCCANFGVPADITRFGRRAGGPLAVTPGTAYSLVAVGKSRPALKCLICGEIFSLKSNLAVIEELRRFSHYLKVDALRCPDPECANHVLPVGTPKAYKKFGQTAAGSPRWQCLACQKTFSTPGKATRWQHTTHVNKSILLALTNKVPMRRIIKINGLGFGMLYRKIDFLHRQCLLFAGARERDLPNLAKERLYLSVDRQDYMINWDRDSDRRNIVLRAVGSADNDSGYVFGMHVNFDASLDPKEVEKNAAASRDADLPYPHRKYARLWLAVDYEDALKASAAEKARKAAKAAKGPKAGTLGEEILDSYEAAEAREDSEVSEVKDEDERLPDQMGVQVHEEYSLYGHFQLLKRLLPNVGKLRFFLDQDSGIRAACLAAFPADIRRRRVDAFYVRTKKDITIDQKRAWVTAAQRALNRRIATDDLSPADAAMAMMKEEIAAAATLGKWSDRWCSHPTPNMSEPAKAMCWLTDLGDYDTEHQARLYLKASVAAIDNFFQRVRRSLNPLERPLQTASRNRRTWYGYSPYNPAMVQKLLDIYRVMHNFVEVGKDGQTPAMRLGTAKGVVTPEDVIYFVP